MHDLFAPLDLGGAIILLGAIMPPIPSDRAADGELDIRVWFFAAASLSYPSPTVILGGAKNLRGGG